MTASRRADRRPWPATGVYLPFLIAVSLGAVFMGANTYIGNGPNFMVKSHRREVGREDAQLLRLHGL